MTPLNRPDFPTVIDNTIRTSFVACPRRAYWAFFRHLTSSRVSIHLAAGAAYAKGLEVFRRSYYTPGLPTAGDFERSVLAGFYALTRMYGSDEQYGDHGTAKTWEGVCAAYLSYVATFHPETDFLRPFLLDDGRVAVEMSGVIPLEERHPVTGDPLLYSVRADMIAERGGVLWNVDDKTTSQMGPTWSQGWDLRSQFDGYAWGVKQLFVPVVGTIVRGTAIQKTGIKHGQAIIYHPEWKIARWYEQLHRDIRRMIRCWEEGYFDYNLADSCTSFGGCGYYQLCTKEDPEPWIEGSYIIRRWDPTLSDVERLARERSQQ